MDWFPHTSADDMMDEVAGILARAKSALFITGAGLSADSGLPTYRGVSGLYNRDAEVEDGMQIEEILSGETFAIRPVESNKHQHCPRGCAVEFGLCFSDFRTRESGQDDAVGF